MLTNNSNETTYYLDIDTLGSPDVILYLDSDNICIMAVDMQKLFKIESNVNYLDGEE